MTDIVERLREDIVEWEGHYSDEMIPRYYPPPPLQLEAADTIERLRAENEALQAQIEVWRAACDAALAARSKP